MRHSFLINIHPDLIKDFEIENGYYDFEWDHRCDICDLSCVSARGIKVHKARMHKAQQEKPQNFKGTLADKAVATEKMMEQQDQRPHILCEGKKIENVFRFSYLGSTFTADDDQHKDIQEKIGRAMSRCGKLRPILDSPDLCVSIKLRLYQAAVCSLLTYGCETWQLTKRAMRQINGANSRMLARFTRKSIPQEARPWSTSFDLVLSIRKRRLRWLGHILRAGEEQPAFQAMVEQSRRGRTGNLLMDAPVFQSIEQLAQTARDRVYWRALVRNLKWSLTPDSVRTVREQQQQRTRNERKIERRIELMIYYLILF